MSPSTRSYQLLLMFLLISFQYVECDDELMESDVELKKMEEICYKKYNLDKTIWSKEIDWKKQDIRCTLACLYEGINFIENKQFSLDGYVKHVTLYSPNPETLELAKKAGSICAKKVKGKVLTEDCLLASELHDCFHGVITEKKEV